MIFRNCLFLLCLVCASASADSPLQTQSIGDLQLESGEVLLDCTIGYRVTGTLNTDKSNVIIMPSWFTGTTADLLMAGLIGPGKLADTSLYYVVSIDALGNGVSTSPSNSALQSGAKFPKLSIKDMVNSQYKLLTEKLGIHHAKAVIGISMGGMQTFQWLSLYPEFMEKAVPIDGSPKMTSYDLVQWKTHQTAIQLLQGAGVDNSKIMALLSSLNLLTLWTPDYFVEKVAPTDVPALLSREEQGYADEDAYDYLSQIHAMIGHDVFAKRNADAPDYTEIVLADVLVVGVAGDQMVNPAPGKALAASIGASYADIESNAGHMGTTVEADEVARLVSAFLE